MISGIYEYEHEIETEEDCITVNLEIYYECSESYKYCGEYSSSDEMADVGLGNIICVDNDKKSQTLWAGEKKRLELEKEYDTLVNRIVEYIVNEI